MSFKICTIGCGQLANSHHGPSYIKYKLQNPDVELTACCDIDPGKAEVFAKRFGFHRIYSDALKMLEKEKPDAVCILVPPDQICQLTCRCLEMGIPVLLEKPPGINLDEVDKLIEMAEQTQTPNQVAFNRRYTPLVRKLKFILKSNSNFIPLQHVRYDFCRIGRMDTDFSTTAIHGIDTTRFIAGSDYSSVHFYYQNFTDLGPNAANIYMECIFASGTTAHLNFTPLSGAVLERATLHSYNKIFFLHLPVWKGFDYPGRLFQVEDNQITMDLAGPQLSSSDGDYILNGFYGENAAFFDDIRDGKSPEGDIKSSRQSVALAQAIRERHSVYRK